MKRVLIILLVITGNVFAGSASQHAPSVVAATVAAVAAHYGYSLWRTPDTTMPTFDELGVVTLVPIEKPTDSSARVYTSDEASTLLTLKSIDMQVDINGKFYRVQSGIPDAIKKFQQVSIYSGGCGAVAQLPAHSAIRLIKAGSIHGPCITFRYVGDRSRARFNFCQEQDIACLNQVYERLVAQNPDARLILRGSSKGATSVLHFLADKAAHSQKIDNVQAVVVDSAPLSLQRALSCYPFSHALARFVFPNYDDQRKTILDSKPMPQVPIFFGRIPTDTIAPADDIEKMARHLQQQNNENVWLFTADQPAVHGRISTLASHRLAVNAFYKHCGLAHNLTPDETQIADALLQQAKVSVQ